MRQSVRLNATIMPNEIEAEIIALRGEIERANREYYLNDAPSLSDDQYDALMRRLVELESDNPDLVTPNSPTQRVGAPLESDFAKVSHAVPMLSLKDVRGEEELLDWEKSMRRHVALPDDAPVEFVCEPKIDGLSAAVVYENGLYTRGVTRGNGLIGEDVTANIRTIRAVPARLQLGVAPALFEARGEVFMLRSEFEKYNEKLESEGKPKLANPRNGSAGAVRQKDPKETANRPLNFFAYTLGAVEGVSVKSQWELLDLLEQSGFRVNPLRRTCANMDEVREFISWFEGERGKLDYATDGVVVKVNDFHLQNELGYIGRNPRWACAFKFPPDEVVTSVLNIDVNVGRLGTLTPMAYFEPVEIAGTTVSKATLNNADVLAKKDVRVGDKVVIRKAGEIIPEVVRVLVEARTGAEKPYEFPTQCPRCSSHVVADGPRRLCENSSCPAQLERLVEHFVARDAMNIDRVGIELGKRFIEAGLVHDVADLFLITKEQLLGLERMAEKSAQNVLDSIEKSKTPPLANLLYALGIPNIGSNSSELLAERYGTLEGVKNATPEEIEAIHDLGKTASAALRGWLDEPHNQQLLDKLLSAGVAPLEVEKKAPDARFAGKSFVFTGTLNLDRRDAEKMVKDLGARAGSSVSKKTDFLVAGENAGSKLDKARENKVTVLTEAEFLALIASDGDEQAGAVAASGDEVKAQGELDLE